MNLQERIDLLSRLGDYMLADDGNDWPPIKERAAHENAWFIPEFIDLATKQVASAYLQKKMLEKWVGSYQVPSVNNDPKRIGIVMAGNIPLVGFHDLICIFISGHRAIVKPSSKDSVLVKHLVDKLSEWNQEAGELIRFDTILKSCDAYIATGSNNSAGYFEYYFRKYPHIIRKNRTLAAILSGGESREELSSLADDVFLYFGLGCRNVTKIYVPAGYDFIPLLTAFRKFDYLADYHKYKNNYDYNLAVLILNKRTYMSTPALLLDEQPGLFSPISQLNYEFYDNPIGLTDKLKENPAIQCIVGNEGVAFGKSQFPGISEYADGVDTLAFCLNL